MATYTTRNRLVKQATNENKNTWGERLNAGAVDLIDFAMDGITSLALTGDVSLTTANGAVDEARARTLLITSTGGSNRTVTIPAAQKLYNVVNKGANIVTVKTAAGVGVAVAPNLSFWILCDGTDCQRLGSQQFTLLSTTSTATGGTKTITLDGYGCVDFRLLFIGVSASATTTMLFELSPDNSTWTTAQPIAYMPSAGGTHYGSVEIFNATAGSGSVVANSNSITSNNAVAISLHDVTTGMAYSWAWRMSAGVKYIRFSTFSGGFDAGSIELWGR